MTTYLGPLGGLVALDCPSSLRPVASRASVEQVTTGGRLLVQVAPRALREWSLEWGVATPGEIAALAALAAGEFGYGPFWFVDPWAQVTNLLPPEASVLGITSHVRGSIGGPVTLADGQRAGRSLVISDPGEYTLLPMEGATAQPVPVVPGQAVTGSIYATGTAAQIRLQWYDAAGSQLPSTSFSSPVTASAPTRIHRTAMPPAGAVAVLVTVTGAVRVARPAITWTDTLMDWHVGQGSASVMLPPTLSQDIILATREAQVHGRMASVSTTIREVG